MLYFEKLRHFVARILDKGRRVRVWIISIFKKKKTEPPLEEQIDIAKARVEQEVNDASIEIKIPKHYDEQGKISEDTFYKKLSDFKYYDREVHHCCKYSIPDNEYLACKCISDNEYLELLQDPYERMGELHLSLLKKFEEGIKEISSKSHSYYEKVYDAVILYFDIVYNKEINKTSVENLHRLPYLDLFCVRQESSQNTMLIINTDFIPMRYSFDDYKAGRISLSKYAKVLAEFGNLICFKSHPEWGMIFVMELILLVLKYPSKEAEDLLCLENFLREESFIPQILEIEKESKEIKEYTDRKKKLAEKLIDELKKHGICFSQKKSDAQNLIESAVKYYDKIFRWKHQWNKKGFTYPDFIKCSSWTEIKTIWKKFTDDMDNISNQAENSCDCLKCPSKEELDQMRKYQKFTKDKISIKRRFNSLKNLGIDELSFVRLLTEL